MWRWHNEYQRNAFNRLHGDDIFKELIVANYNPYLRTTINFIRILKIWNEGNIRWNLL